MPRRLRKAGLQASGFSVSLNWRVSMTASYAVGANPRQRAQSPGPAFDALIVASDLLQLLDAEPGGNRAGQRAVARLEMRLVRRRAAFGMGLVRGDRSAAGAVLGHPVDLLLVHARLLRPAQRSAPRPAPSVHWQMLRRMSLKPRHCTSSTRQDVSADSPAAAQLCSTASKRVAWA